MTILPTMFVVLLGCVFPVQGWKVLVADGLAPTAMRVLSAGGVQTVEQHLPSKELAAGALADFDAVIIRSATTLSADAISAGAAGRLRIIGRAGVGVDNIDLPAAQAANVWVLNTPGASTISLVELTMAHLMAAARGLQLADYGLKSGLWLKGQLRLAAPLAISSAPLVPQQHR